MFGILITLSGLSFPQEVLRTYEGVDKNRPCSLFVHQELKNADGAYQVEVSTSYQHQGQGLGKVTLSFAGSLPSNSLIWESPETGESLRVLLKEQASVLEEPQAFRIRWVHFDHVHDTSCLQLQKVNQQ